MSVIALLAVNVAVASSPLADTVRQAHASTGAPVAVCTVGSSARSAAERALAEVPKGAWVQRSVAKVGDPEAEMRLTMERTGAACAVRVWVDGGLQLTTFGDCERAAPGAATSRWVTGARRWTGWCAWVAPWARRPRDSR